VLEFPAGLPAFPHAHRFALAPWGGDDSPFRRLECIDHPGLAFVVIDPSLFFPEYMPELEDEAAARLEIDDAEDALVLTILTLGNEPQDATANLLGPLIVNRRTLQAAQVVLTDREWPARAPLVAA
jgi:flagellar assembly factor FliW